MLVATRQSMSSPTELYRVDPRSSEAETLTSFNAELLWNIELARVERRIVRGTDGADIHTWVIYPPGFDAGQQYPAILYAQGGPQSTVSQFFSYRWNFQMMAANGYVIVAPEYRGSTGYGRGVYENIDYGGLETEDAHALGVDEFVVLQHVLAAGVGMIGWSHGGLISLMNCFRHPDDYACLYAGVPVSDLVARMGYQTQGYRDLYSADYHVGKTAHEDVDEYRRRSPVTHAHKQKVPLLIHTNTNDRDVNVLEVERLIQALQAGGKSGFEYRIYQDAPGGHSFNRLDTQLAKESRAEIWRFLAPHLRPADPVR